jgi:hypothetical protein
MVSTSINHITSPLEWTETNNFAYTKIMPTKTFTSTRTFTLTPSMTLSPSITKTHIWAGPIPDTILERASVSGMTPEEIMDTYYIIHNALGANDPSMITDLIWYPLIGCNRCGGRTVKTPNDFIKLYHDKMNEKTRSKLFSQKPEELFINYEGVMFGNGEIWFSKLCKNNDPQSCNIYIDMFLYYCMDDESKDTPLKIDETNFVFGKYATKTYDTVGGTALDNKDINEIMSAQIEIYPNRYWADTNGWFGQSCASAKIEFCPEIDTNVTDISAIGRLNIVCGEDIYEIFDIKSETELIMYYDGFNFFLQHIST